MLTYAQGSSCKMILASMIGGVPLLVQLLTALQPPTKEHAHRASKRPKMDQ